MPYIHTCIILLCWLLVELVSGQARFEMLRDSETLVSKNGEFEVGFFRPRNSSNRYVGVWYSKRDSGGLEVVWVANRDSPLKDSSGVLKIAADGNLQVLDGQKRSIWSTNLTAYNANDSFVELQDTGNLVLNATGMIMWQSFDHPTDTFLPQMTFTINASVGEKQQLFRSWKSPSDPSAGNFTFGLTTRDPPEVFLWENDRPIWRYGPWNGNMFVGSNSVLSIVNNNDGLSFFGFSLGSQPGNQQHFVLNYDGGLVQRAWDNVNSKWEITWSSRELESDVYGKCGAFGSRNSTSSNICVCLKGFVPKNNTEWSQGNWTSGCVRRTSLQCGVTGDKADVFWKLDDFKVPDNAVWLSASSEDDCSHQCHGMCSCLAYSYFASIGCMIWNAPLIDVEGLSDNRGIDLYIRLASSELALSNQQQTRKSSHWKIIVIVLVPTGIIALGVCMCHLRVKWLRQKYGTRITRQEARQLGQSRLLSFIIPDDKRDVKFGDLPTFELEKLVSATNYFHLSNKLGQGGFGTVYKGVLENGEEVAIKRLSNLSGQGLKEFMTEVEVIANLQHRNLVRLLGCCAEGEEKILVYEYMPNKSLDAMLFDPFNRERLDWKTRFNIIQGVCRGLLYLHRDSRLRIIHRDLKASNILLDENLAPKISDFGMARIFGGNQDQADTNRVVGTYGYMSPEYAMEGRFSEKSDVFSLGVLLLEIISGRRNGSFKDEVSFSLLGQAWKFWNDDDIKSLIDPTISGQSSHADILRCIQVALLCVQEFPEDRPNISVIISMIDSEVLNLPLPKQPGFTQRRDTSSEATDGNEYQSVNLVSVSLVGAR